jgi:hypothetical protein
MTIFYCLRVGTPLTWRARSPYLYPPGTGWPGYTPRHWVPFHRLLRLVGLRWRYSTQPPHGIIQSRNLVPRYRWPVRAPTGLSTPRNPLNRVAFGWPSEAVETWQFLGIEHLSFSHRPVTAVTGVSLPQNTTVAKHWLCKQRPLLGNPCNIHASNNRTTGLCNSFLSYGW